MSKIRIMYHKVGRAKYISHLDLAATFQRAFLRAGMKLKYSEGFNPHPYISVALPLSVGFESRCELVDVALIGENLPDIKSIKLPEGITIYEIYHPTRKFNDIKWIEVAGSVNYGKLDSKTVNDIKKALTRDSIIITKRSKRGIKEIDIAPHIKDFEIRDNAHLSDKNDISISMKISAQDPMLNVTDIINALGDELKPVSSNIFRVGLYDADMNLFR